MEPNTENPDGEAAPIQSAEVLELGAGIQVLDALKLRLAEQIAPRPWRKHLANLAQECDRGEPLGDVFAKHQAALPDELRCLMREALRVRDPASLLVDSMRIRSKVREGWRSFVSISVYPALLFIVALTVGIAFSYCMQNLVFFDWIEDFGLAGTEQIRSGIDDQHNAMVGLGVLSAWVILVLLTIFVAGPPWAWIAVVGGVIVIGKPLRWLSLQEVLHRYQLFFDQGMDAAEISHAVSRSFARSGQSVVTRAIADRVDAGMPIGRALGTSMLSDGLCRPALFLLDHPSTATDRAFAETATLMGNMVDQRCRTLASIVPVFVLAMVGTVIWGALSSYYMGLTPLIQMISALA